MVWRTFTNRLLRLEHRGEANAVSFDRNRVDGSLTVEARRLASPLQSCAVKPDLILLDADGVLWRGGEVIPQAPGFIRRAHAAGIRCLLITNNAGLNREAYAAKCRRLELDFAREDIFS